MYVYVMTSVSSGQKKNVLYHHLTSYTKINYFQVRSPATSLDSSSFSQKIETF